MATGHDRVCMDVYQVDSCITASQLHIYTASSEMPQVPLTFNSSVQSPLLTERET